MNKILTLTFIALIIGACGGSDQAKETQFYKKKQTVPETLEVSIEASGFGSESQLSSEIPLIRFSRLLTRSK